jgi:murein L,D-transpeptidase YcbB/YkuD
MQAKRRRISIGKMFAPKGLERERQRGSARREAERGMSALPAGNWRRLLMQGAAGVVIALAANLSWADAPPSAGPGPANQGRLAILSPETPPSFGDLGAASPLLAVFNLPNAGRDPALGASLFAEPTFNLASAAQIALNDGATPQPAPEPTPQDSPPRVDYDPTAGPLLSSMQSALYAALDRLVARGDRVNPLGLGDWRAARARIAAFYAARFYEPVWVGQDGLTEAGRSALSRLERAREDGLDLSGFTLPRGLSASLAPDALAEAETTIASAVVTYAEQATGSRVPPSRVSRLIFAAPNVADPGAALAETAAAADPAERLADFNPPQKGYRELRDELKRLIDPAPVAGKRRVPTAGRIHTASASTSDAFAFGPLARQTAAILANMEMWRWEPRDMGERRIEVNVADFSVAALEGDRVILHSRVIVGKPETPTPIFSNIMRYVIINPFWRVPDSIIKKELAPKLGALSRRGYEVTTVGGRLTVRQLPGDDNALGRLAFMFPNDHAIYLHDTPTRELFDEETRAFSHGCVRVEDPLSLAELVLGGEKSGWTEERIESAFGDKERTVFLPHPLPIHIVYFTDFVDEFGELQERPDVYGLIRKVEGILARASQD